MEKEAIKMAPPWVQYVNALKAMFAKDPQIRVVYDDERAANVALRNDISNFQQSQYILGQTGRWVAWTGSGSQTAPTT